MRIGGISMFLLQMAGFPGSGKSTLAKEISKYIDVIVDSSLSIETYIQKVLNYIGGNLNVG